MCGHIFFSGCLAEVVFSGGLSVRWPKIVSAGMHATHFATSKPQLQQLESGADEAVQGRLMWLEVGPSGLRREPLRTSEHIAKAARRKPLRHYLAAGLFFFAREAQAAKSLREAASPGRPGMKNPRIHDNVSRSFRG